jgi:hypothetical protein
MRVISFFIGIGNVPLSPGDKRGQNVPRGQFCPQGTILSPGDNFVPRGQFCPQGDNFLEFCPFVPEIAKFVPFSGDKFGDIAKINFVPK